MDNQKEMLDDAVQRFKDRYAATTSAAKKEYSNAREALTNFGLTKETLKRQNKNMGQEYDIVAGQRVPKGFRPPEVVDGVYFNDR
jgi:hypothetical protein